MDPFIGEIRVFGFNYAPVDWAACDGSRLLIGQYQALYAVIGTTYGGDGRSYFLLPNLQGTAPMGWGTGPGLSPNVLGQQVGATSVTLTPQNLPAHTHQAHVRLTASKKGYVITPTAQAYVAPDFTSKDGGSTFAANKEFTPTANTQFAPTAIQSTGGSGPHENRQPFLTLNFCIALNGVFPPRP